MLRPLQLRIVQPIGRHSRRSYVSRIRRHYYLNEISKACDALVAKAESTPLDESGQEQISKELKRLALSGNEADVVPVLQCAQKLSKLGVSLSDELTAVLLRTLLDGLVQRPEHILFLFQCFEEGLFLQHAPVTEGPNVRSRYHLVKLVLEASKRLRRADIAVSTFNQYWDSLSVEEQMNDLRHPTLWTDLISAHGAAGDLVGAISVFSEWRTRLLDDVHVSPKELSDAIPLSMPHVALLRVFSRVLLSNSAAAETENYDKVLQASLLHFRIIESDALRSSAPLTNALLEYALSTTSFAQVWSLWDSICKNSEIKTNGKSWQLLVKAVLRQKYHNVQTPQAPPLRGLFHHFYKAHLFQTRKSPRSELGRNTIVSTDSLNAFLRAFIETSDYPAAAVVLSCFEKCRVSPSLRTHQILVSLAVAGQDKFRPPSLLEAGGETDYSGNESLRNGVRRLHNLEHLLNKNDSARRYLATTPSRRPAEPEVRKLLHDFSYATTSLQQKASLDWHESVKEASFELLTAAPPSKKSQKRMYLNKYNKRQGLTNRDRLERWKANRKS